MCPQADVRQQRTRPADLQPGDPDYGEWDRAHAVSVLDDVRLGSSFIHVEPRHTALAEVTLFNLIWFH